jgi:hypothetical protein
MEPYAINRLAVSPPSETETLRRESRRKPARPMYPHAPLTWNADDDREAPLFVRVDGLTS